MYLEKAQVRKEESFTLYKKQETAAKIAYLTLSFAIAPGIAIASGGLLTKFFSWDSCFYASLVYAFLAIVFTLQLPETLKKNQIVPLNMSNILEGYIVKLKNKTLIKASLIMGCGTTFIYLFASLAPFIGINELKLTPEKYGFYNFIPPIGMIFGFYLTQQLQKRHSCLAQIKFGIIISSAFTVLFTACFALGFIHPMALFLPIPGIYTGLCLIFANSSSLAIGSANNKSNASSMTNFLNMSLCVGCLFIAEALPYKASILLPLFYSLISICMIVLFLRLKNDPKAKDLIKKS